MLAAAAEVIDRLLDAAVSAESVKQTICGSQRLLPERPSLGLRGQTKYLTGDSP
jgi:hypothetical protein